MNKNKKIIWFDVSDLLGYFPDNRTPTGIQRVQICIILSLLDGEEASEISLCRFLEDEDGWYEVEPEHFKKVCELSLAASNAQDPAWRREVALLRQKAVESCIKHFPQHSVLINIGTSWWLPNYFVHIRAAKEKSNIYYIPFIHDVIPAVTPDFCAHELVHEFIDWFMGVVQHADRYFAVSESSKRDFLQLASELKVQIPSDDVRVVHLAAEKRALPEDVSTTLFRRHGIEPGKFVFFVSTVESRKNQVGALEVWKNLIRDNPGVDIPKLVIVGKRGFESHFFQEKLNNFIDADKHVAYIESVSDEELAWLYGSCLFTIYPSYYEGWGLPITESLGYGKVCVTADNSSLPEAGQGLTVTYRTGSNRDFADKLLSLIRDRKKLNHLEQHIQANFKSRTWQKIAKEVVAFARSVHAHPERQAKHVFPVLEPAYYPLNRNRQLNISTDLTSAEVLRRGSGWHRLEDFGSWTRKGEGVLAFAVASSCKRIGIQCKGLPSTPTKVAISANHSSHVVELTLHPDETTWCFLEFEEDVKGKELEIYIHSKEVETVIDPVTLASRDLSGGVGGIYIFDAANPAARTDFIEENLFDLLKNRKIKDLPCIN